MLHRASINMPTVNSWRRSGLRTQARTAADTRIVHAGTLDTWVTADDLPGTTAALETWNARVGVSPTQASAGLRPSVEFNSLGRLEVLFDNVGQALACGVDLSGTGQASVVMSAYTNNAAIAGVVYEYGTSPTVDHGILTYINFGRMNIISAAAGISSMLEERIVDGVDTDRFSIIGKFDNSVSPNGIEMWKTTGLTSAQVTLFKQQTITSTAPTNYNANPSWLGSRNNGASSPLDGGMDEFAVYVESISALATLAVLDAITQKHSVGW